MISATSAAVKRTWSALCVGFGAARESWNSTEKTIDTSTGSTTEPIVWGNGSKRRKINKVSSSSSPPSIQLNVEKAADIDNTTSGNSSGNNSTDNLPTVAVDQEQNNFGKVSPLPPSFDDTSKEDNESGGETDTTSEDTFDFGDSNNDDLLQDNNEPTVELNNNEHTAVDKDLASLILSNHINKLSKKSPLREGEYDIVLKRIASSFGTRLSDYRTLFTRLWSINANHLIVGNQTVESNPTEFFVTAIQGKSVVHINHESQIDMIRGIDSQQIAIRFQHKINFHERFQHSLLPNKQRNKKYTANGISTLFRCVYDSSRDSRVITLDSKGISALIEGVRFSDVAITKEATNPIALGSNDCSTVASIKDIPTALLDLPHLKLLLRNEGLSKVTLGKMKNRNNAIQYIADNTSDKMITTEDSIQSIEKVPALLAVLGTRLLSGDYSDSISLSKKGVISVDIESFSVVLKQVCGSTYDMTQFTKVSMILFCFTICYIIYTMI